MEEDSGSCHVPSKSRRNLLWEDLSLTGRFIACVLFFLLYLGPSHAMSTTTNYPWHFRLLLYLPWFIIGFFLLVPRLNLVPVNPHIFAIIAVFISSIVVAVVSPEGQVPEWATTVAVAGLAALMTGPMLRGYDKNRERTARSVRSGEPELPITRDLKS